MIAADRAGTGPLPGEQRTPLEPGLAVVPLRSPTLPPATRTNCWLLGVDEVLVVDPASPWPGPQEALHAALAGRRVRAILLTHHHVDHVSGVADLVARTGAEVWAHADTAARLSLPVDRTVADGALIELDDRAWRAVHTPGHASGHLCLHDPRAGWVVAGDMVAGEGTIVLDPPEGDLALYLASLERLGDLGPTHLLPAHGPSVPHGQGLLAEWVEHRNRRTAQVCDALRRRGASAALALVPDIYPQLPPALHPFGARQILCHLRWLEARGAAAPLEPHAGADDAAWTLR